MVVNKSLACFIPFTDLIRKCCATVIECANDDRAECVDLLSKIATCVQSIGKIRLTKVVCAIKRVKAVHCFWIYWITVTNDFISACLCQANVDE